MSTKIIKLTLLLLATALFLIPTYALSKESKKVFNLTFAWYDWGDKSTSNLVYAPGGWFQRMLYERSDGRIRLKIIPKMFPSEEVLSAVAMGKVDMGDANVATAASTYPLWNWAELPGLLSTDYVKNMAQEQAVQWNPRIQAIWDKTYREIGLVYLFQTQWPMTPALWTDKKITKVSDLEGMKIRAIGYMQNLEIRALKAKPVTLPWAEILPSMRTGVVDAAMGGFGGFYLDSGWNIKKYVIGMPIGYGWLEATVMNAKKFDSLPPDLQKVIRDVSREVSQMVGFACLESDRFAMQGLKSAGMEILRLDDKELQKAQEMLKPTVAEWLKIAGPYGPEVLSIIADEVAKYESFDSYPK